MCYINAYRRVSYNAPWCNNQNKKKPEMILTLQILGGVVAKLCGRKPVHYTILYGMNVNLGFFAKNRIELEAP